MPTRIAVTGHRLLVERPELTREVDVGLAAIESRWRGPFALVSGMAAGADAFVAGRALARGWSLEALLPLPATAFREDFDDAAARELDDLLARAASVAVVPGGRPRPDCYTASADAMLARCVELVALWNGASARGVGGTGDVVAAARGRGLPVSWIRAADVQDTGA